MSPDVCDGRRARRCTRRNPRFALQASLGFLRPLHDTGSPEPVTPPPETSMRRFLDNPNLLVRQPIQLIDELVDLPIRRINLPLNRRLGMRRFG